MSELAALIRGTIAAHPGDTPARVAQLVANATPWRMMLPRKPIRDRGSE